MRRQVFCYMPNSSVLLLVPCSQLSRKVRVHTIHGGWYASRAHHRVLLNRGEISGDHRRNLTVHLLPGVARLSSSGSEVLSYRAFPPCLSPNIRTDLAQKTQKLLGEMQKSSAKAGVKWHEPQLLPGSSHHRLRYEWRKNPPLL